MITSIKPIAFFLSIFLIISCIKNDENGKKDIAPVADFAASPDTVILGQSINFKDLSTNSPSSWDWDFGDGTSSKLSNPTHSYTLNGSYSITLRVANNYGSDTIIKSNYIVVNPAIAEFSVYTSSIILDHAVQFTDLSLNDPISWNWNFGDGITSTLQNPLHTYSTTGNYTITLTVSNGYSSDMATKANYIKVSVKSGGTGILKDYDGNAYNTVVINTQEWMAENLKVTHYADGTSIPLVTDNTQWKSLGDNNADKAYCFYNNNVNSEYGALYTWAAAMKGAASSNIIPSGVQGVCPTGWHLPSDAEWDALENFLIANGYNYDNTVTGNKIAKALALDSGWNFSSNTEGAVGNTDYAIKRNVSGFSGLPGGTRYCYDGLFSESGESSYWWGSTEDNSGSGACQRSLYSRASIVNRAASYLKSNGLSVRCIKD